MFSIDVSELLGSQSEPDGSRFAIMVTDGEGNRLAIRVPSHLGPGLLVATADAAADAERYAGRPGQPIFAEGWLLQPAPIDDHQTLTVRVEGGLNLHFLVPTGSGRAMDQSGDV